MAGGVFLDAGVVSLRDAATGKPLLREPLKVNEGGVTCIAFSADGGVLAAGFGVTTPFPGVVLWDVASRQRLMEQSLSLSHSSVESLAFHPDGGSLAAGADLYDVGLESWKRKAGVIANRNLSRDEWGEYFPDEPYRRTFSWLGDSPSVPWQNVDRSYEALMKPLK